MAIVKPFRGVRPPKDLVAKLTARPYDVLSSEEAREEAQGKPMSLYHISRPEINFPVGTDEHDERVYDEAARQYQLFKESGWLRKDDDECFYLYAETWHGKTQHGLVVAASAEDYRSGVILRHELTRRDKEDDRMRHVMSYNANLGPAFFAYPTQPALNAIIERVSQTEPEYDFTVDDVRHQFWVINDAATIFQISVQFSHMPHLYIADGHHRSAAAARVAEEKKNANPNHTGKEEYNYFLAVCFPDNELTVLDYNRILKDLNGMNSKELLRALSVDFEVEDKGTEIYHPACQHEFSLYLDEHWYCLKTRPEHIFDDDPIRSLDVSISSELIINKLFGITDLRSDKRIDFIGGIRGLEELKKRVDQGDAACALALYPVSMQQIFRVADSGNIMPPKATWFEPKLRSGVVIHELD